MELTKKEMHSLCKEIAEYGERAYRRGFQHGVCSNADEDFASRLRHKSYSNIYEVIGIWKSGALTLSKRPLMERLSLERIGPLIDQMKNKVVFYLEHKKMKTIKGEEENGKSRQI